MKALGITIAVAMVLVVTATTEAGLVVIGGGIKPDGSFTVTQGVEAFDISYSATRVDVRDEMARVTVSQDLEIHPRDGSNCLAILVLPADIEGDSLSVTFAGVEMPHTVLDKDRSQSFLRTAVRVLKREALLSIGGGKLAVVPLTAPHRMQQAVIRYDMPAVSQDGVLRLRVPMPSATLTRHPVRRAVVSVTLQSDLPLRSIFSPTHNATVTYPEDGKGEVLYAMDSLRDATPFDLIAVSDRESFGWRTFVHRPTLEEDGFFLVTGCPSGTTRASGPKDFVFAIDISGSMRGEKMEQARAALEYCMDQLGEQDRFNIVAFSDKVAEFREELTPVSPAHRRAACDYIDSLTPEGMTNIDEALATAVSGKKSDRPRMIIFLTDGTPTVGERNTQTILSRMKTANTAEARVFVMGIGHEVNTFLLDSVAETTGGESTYVDPREDLDEEVATLFNRLQFPVLLNPVASFHDLKVTDVAPQVIPDLFRNTLVVLAGRYSEGGSGEIELTGQCNGKPVSLHIPIALPDNAAPDNTYIATLWSARRIGESLEEIRLHGENDELVENVVSLSRRYGIMTEYTDVIDTDEASDLSDKEVAKLARQKMRRARQVQSGKWAVMQSRNDKGLKGRVSSAAADNAFINAQGEEQRADNIRQIGSSAYYFRKGAWVPADDGRERKQREITRFSPEYFKLAETSRDFARAAALGGEVTVNMENEQITIK